MFSFYKSVYLQTCKDCPYFYGLTGKISDLLHLIKTQVICFSKLEVHCALLLKILVKNSKVIKFVFNLLASTANYLRGAGEQAHTLGDLGSTAKK